MIEDLRALGAKAVLLKGGHLEKDENSNDLLILPTTSALISAKRFPTKNTHGTGCTLSSAIASFLAQGNTLTQAVDLGKQYFLKRLLMLTSYKSVKAMARKYFFAGTVMSVNTIGVQLSNATLRYRDSEHATLSGLSLS